jgi:excisionase family DNA binding protein
MSYTLGQAAKATGTSKPTLSRAIKSGRLSAQKQEDGSYLIDPAELHRVYPPVSATSDDNGNAEQVETLSNTSVLQAQLEILREERERERGQFQATIATLTEDRDQWREQAKAHASTVENQAAALATATAASARAIAQSEEISRRFLALEATKPPAPEPTPPPTFRPWVKPVLAVLGVLAVIGGLALWYFWPLIQPTI